MTEKLTDGRKLSIPLRGGFMTKVVLWREGGADGLLTHSLPEINNLAGHFKSFFSAKQINWPKRKFSRLDR